MTRRTPVHHDRRSSDEGRRRRAAEAPDAVPATKDGLKRRAPIGAVAGAATLILAGGAAHDAAAQSLFGQVFTPAPPDTETVIERAADRERADQERNEALRRVLNLDSEAPGGPVVLEADKIEYDATGQFVVASGDVEVFYAGRSLRADEIRYDGVTDTIDALGDIRVVNNDGSVLVADEAKFDSEIRDGLIRGARGVLADGQARIAAVEARRVDGKFTQLSKAVFSPCEVCELDPTPLWRIRARKVIQDEEARDILYEDATFEVFGVPVAYLPRFRHPDPTVKRRSGFLVPQFQSTNELGISTRVPYFYNIAPNRDATISVYAHTEENPVLEGEYRALIESGSYEIAGAATYAEDFEPNVMGEDHDDFGISQFDEDGFRGYFEGEGRFALGLGPNDAFGLAEGFEVGFDALIASDDTFLRRYRYSSIDRTEARIFAERFGEAGFFSAEAIRFQSLREREPTETTASGVILSEFAGQIPLVGPHVEFEQFYRAPVIGGAFSIGGDLLNLRRTNGRDVTRLSTEVGWARGFANQYGVLLDATASLRGDFYQTFDDPAFNDETEFRGLPLASLTARWPLARQDQSGGHVVEPIAQIIWAPYGGNPNEIPNEDSQDTELDELSIFTLNRFSGLDRWEEGPRATLGVRYNYFALNGMEAEATLGQSFRPDDISSFSENSGLNGVTSDVVGAWRLAAPSIATVGQRFRISDAFEIERNELYGQAEFFDRFRFSSSYVFLNADPETGAEDDREEANFAAAVDVSREWTVAGDVRRDLEESRFVTAGGALRYANECCEVDFSIRRRFNDVDDLPPSTDFGLVVRLKGLGTE